MKKHYLALFIIVAFIGCATIGRSESAQDFSDAVGKEWKLLEVYIDEVNTQFKRDAQPSGLSRDIFTLQFEDGTISGAGAPNRYSGQYTLSGENRISISSLRSTLMASLFEPENLREYDYFYYLQNANKWRLVNNGLSLEIYSLTDKGSLVTMLFGL